MFLSRQVVVKGRWPIDRQHRLDGSAVGCSGECLESWQNPTQLCIRQPLNVDLHPFDRHTDRLAVCNDLAQAARRKLHGRKKHLMDVEVPANLAQ